MPSNIPVVIAIPVVVAVLISGADLAMYFIVHVDIAVPGPAMALSFINYVTIAFPDPIAVAILPFICQFPLL